MTCSPEPRRRSPRISADGEPRVVRLIVIRPEPGHAGTVAAAREMGLDVAGVPLFAVAPRPWPVPDPDGYDALLIGSANVFRYGGTGLHRLRGLPVHAVGETTAQQAKAHGFAVRATGAGGLQQVLAAIPAGTRVLRLAGAERVPLAPPPGVTLDEVVVYASEPHPLPDDLARLLREPAVVALHSAEAARHFAAECDRLRIDRAHLALATIGPRVSGAAGPGWRAVGEAGSPADLPLLAKARDLCHTLAGD